MIINAIDFNIIGIRIITQATVHSLTIQNHIIRQHHVESNNLRDPHKENFFFLESENQHPSLFEIIPY
jgi:hypothetical protein